MSEALDRLSALSGIARCDLEPWTPKWLGHNMEVLGHTVDRSRFLRVNLRICPECMLADQDGKAGGERREDAGYLRIEWMLAFIFGCPEHQLQLLTRCGHCGARPHWKVGTIDRCHCGASLLSQQTVALTRDQSMLLDGLLDRTFMKEPSLSLLRDLGHVDLPQLVWLIRMLGDLAVYGHTPRNAASSLEIDNLPDVLLAGLEVLSDLPRSFERLLDALQLREPQSLKGLQSAYGIPLVRLVHTGRPLTEELRPILYDHSGKAGVTMSSRMLARVAQPAEDSRSEEAPLTEHDRRRLTAVGGLVNPAPPTRSSVLRALKGTEQVLQLMKAAEYVGVTRPVFSRLREGGFVEPIWERPGKRDQFFYRAELEAFLARLRGDAPRVMFIGPEYRRVCSECRARKTDTFGLVRDLLAGEVRCVAVADGFPGISGLLFAARRRRCEVGPPPTQLSNNQLAARLSLRPAEVKALRHAGILDSDQRRKIETSSCRSAVAFDREYILLRHIAQATALTRPEIRRRLSEAGIQTVRDVARPEIYDRRAVERYFGSIPLNALMHIQATPND